MGCVQHSCRREVAAARGRQSRERSDAEGAPQSKTDFGKPADGGRWPPNGDKPHRDVFTVHALEVDRLHADHNVTAVPVGFMINRLRKAGFTAACGRK